MYFLIDTLHGKYNARIRWFSRETRVGCRFYYGNTRERVVAVKEFVDAYVNNGQGWK